MSPSVRREALPPRAAFRSAVLVVNWNSWRDTVQALESVLAGEHDGVQLVVCDNASADGSLERLEEWAAGGDGSGAGALRPLRCARIDRATAERGGDDEARSAELVLIATGGNLGFAGGNNVGLRFLLAAPEMEWIWLLNPDTVVERGALASMVELGGARPDAGVIGSRILFYDEPDIIQAVGGGEVLAWQGMTRFLGRGERDAGQWAEPLEPDYITGCSMLVRAETARAVGLMDERYFLYSEEVDWCLRVRASGWKLLYCPGSVVWHKEGRIVGKKNPLSDYYSVRSSLMLTAKFHPRLMPVVMAHSVFRCLLPKVARMRFDRLGAVMAAYRDFFLRRSGRLDRTAGGSGAR